MPAGLGNERVWESYILLLHYQEGFYRAYVYHMQAACTSIYDSIIL